MSPKAGIRPLDQFTLGRAQRPRRQELSGAGDCVVDLVGLEPTTRVLWNIAVSDQLPWSDTHPSRSPGKSKGDLAEKGRRCPTRVLGRTRTMFLMLWWLMKYQKARKSN